MPIYSPYAIHYPSGCHMENGVRIWNQIGCDVATLEECEAALAVRRLPGGDLDPIRLKVIEDKLYAEIEEIKQREGTIVNEVL